MQGTLKLFKPSLHFRAAVHHAAGRFDGLATGLVQTPAELQPEHRPLLPSGIADRVERCLALGCQVRADRALEVFGVEEPRHRQELAAVRHRQPRFLELRDSRRYRLARQTFRCCAP